VCSFSAHRPLSRMASSKFRNSLETSTSVIHARARDISNSENHQCIRKHCRRRDLL